jgi:putative addiction module CopG family antidote
MGRTRMTLTLEPDLEVMVTERLRSGRYNSVNEVLGEALLRLRNAEREEILCELRAFVQVGVDDLENGRYTTWKIGQMEELAERIRSGAERITNERALAGDSSSRSDESTSDAGGQCGPPESTT